MPSGKRSTVTVTYFLDSQSPRFSKARGPWTSTVEHIWGQQRLVWASRNFPINDVVNNKKQGPPCVASY